MLDSYGRNINYLRISITDLCNLRCRYCMPEEGIGRVEHREILSVEEIIEIAKVFTSLGINKIRLTGGEPLVRKGALDIVKGIGKLEGVKDFAMTTNGLLLKKYAKELKGLGLNRVNISLDTLDEGKYSHITRGGKLKDVLGGIEEAKKVGLNPIKINTVLVKGINHNEIEDLVYWAEGENLDIRFIELMPIGEAAKFDSNHFISNEIVLERLPKLEEIEKEDISSPANYYKLPNGNSKIGLINPISCKFCQNCNRMRITAQGKLKPCLHSRDEIDLKTALRNGQDIEKIILEAIGNKPKEHNLESGQYINTNMNEIGG